MQDLQAVLLLLESGIMTINYEARLMSLEASGLQSAGWAF